MSLTPVERAESLLSEAVEILYSGFRNNDYPEHYVRSDVPRVMRERLHKLRTPDDPVYRFHRAKPVALPAEPSSVPDGSALQPLDTEAYSRLIALANSRVAEAVEALWEGGAAFTEDYIEGSAQKHMAACLRWVRAQESPAERAALVAEVNRLRALVEMGPLAWEEVVTALPVPQSSVG